MVCGRVWVCSLVSLSSCWTFGTIRRMGPPPSPPGSPGRCAHAGETREIRVPTVRATLPRVRIVFYSFVRLYVGNTPILRRECRNLDLWELTFLPRVCHRP